MARTPLEDGEGDTLCRRVMEAKFGVMDRGGYSTVLARLHAKELWKKIYMRRDIFRECIKRRIGNWKSIGLWVDAWSEVGVLKARFLQIFAIIWYKDISVKEAYRDGAGGRVWHGKVMRYLDDWEINEYESLLSCLCFVSLNEDYDQPFWTPSSTGNFRATSFYWYLTKEEAKESNFLLEQIWKVNAPSRVASFAWEASCGCMLTIAKLMRRGRIMVSWCCLYKRAEETCDHILLRCPIAYSLWALAYGRGIASLWREV